MNQEPLAQAIDLKAAYGKNLVLDGVNLDIRPQEILTIIGGSGSGKTTLLKHFIGLYRPTEGSIKVFGKDWSEMDEKEREEVQKRIGVLFQNGALLGSKTVGINIAIPLEQHTTLPDSVIMRVVRLKLRQVGLSDAFKKMPSELSGGMRKRAALARAMVLDPPLIFCDEPSAGLDPLTTYQLDKLLINLRDNLGLSFVVVTHELASIRRISDRITYLEKGKMIFTGTLDEAMKADIPSVTEFFSIGEVKDKAGKGK